MTIGELPEKLQLVEHAAVASALPPRGAPTSRDPTASRQRRSSLFISNATGAQHEKRSTARSKAAAGAHEKLGEAIESHQNERCASARAGEAASPREPA